jgi:hypothetical protein
VPFSKGGHYLRVSYDEGGGDAEGFDVRAHKLWRGVSMKRGVYYLIKPCREDERWCAVHCIRRGAVGYLHVTSGN